MTNPTDEMGGDRLDVLFEQRLHDDPDATALVVDDDSWSRRCLAGLADRMATALEDLDVPKGSMIVAQYATTAEDVALALAACRLGCTLVPVPASLGGYELSYVLELTKPVLLVLHGEEPPTGTEIPDGIPVRAVIDLARTKPRNVERRPFATDGIAVIGLTAGSTGRPKGVMHRWSSLRYAADEARALVQVQQGEAIGMPGAGAGAPGYAFGTYLALTGGQTLVRSAKWDPPRLLALLEERQCVWMMTVPTVMQMLIGAGESRGQRPRLAMRGVSVGGSFIDPELVRRARAVLGVEILRMFGLSECLGHAAMHLDDPGDDRDRFDGRPFPGTEVVALDDDGNVVPLGAEGEAAVRGPSLMVGYFGESSTSAHLTPDGRFRTGDLIRCTAEGYVVVIGRKKDMIIRGGMNLDPAEIEAVVARHPRVRDVAVIGYPDDRLGERACAVVVLRDSEPLQLSDVTEFLAAQGFSKSKFPERLEVRDEMPLSPDGKVLKSRLRNDLATALTGASPTNGGTS